MLKITLPCGDEVPLHEADWYLVAPCGCTAGALVAGFSTGEVVAADATAAFEEFYETKELRKRHKMLGFTVELGHRQAVTLRMMTECPHKPMYGYERPKPKGWRWALAPYSTSRSRLHLIQDLPEDATKQSLCNAQSGRRWQTDDTFHDGHVTCLQCEKKGRVLAKDNQDEPARA